jgi:hypothetical protein
LREFLEWTTSCRETACTARELDELLVEWIEHMYDKYEHKRRQVCVNARCAIQKLLPVLKGKLHGATSSLEGWRKLVPPVSALPMLSHVAVFIAVEMARSGYRKMGLGLLVAWDSYMRVSEMTGVRKEDFCPPGLTAASQGPRASGFRLKAGQTKTSRGKPQWASLKSALLRQLVVQECAGLEDGDHIFNFVPSEFRNVLTTVCDDHGLPAFRPHSTRHGRATEEYMRGMPVADIAMDGRWAAIKSLSTYLQAGKARSQALQVSPLVAKAAAVYERYLHLFLAPPSI